MPRPSLSEEGHGQWRRCRRAPSFSPIAARRDAGKRMKFLVDECLSPELTKLAHDKGYGASSHVTWLGRNGAKDWELKPFISHGDWSLLNKNQLDFTRHSSLPA